MKLEITEKGCFVEKNGKLVEVPVGEFVNVKGVEIPASLINKCRVVGRAKKTKVTNPAESPVQELADEQKPETKKD